MNVFAREMKANRKALIIWSGGMILFVAGSMVKYAGLSASGQSVNDLLAYMPSSLKVIMGLGSFDLTKATGYYGVLFVYLAVMAAIHAVMLGANIISKEERDKTAEFLFIKPISRNKVITSKLLASLVNILIFNLVTFVSSILLLQKYSSREAFIEYVTKLMIGMLVLQFIFLFIGTAAAAVSRRPKNALSFSVAVLLFTFILSVAVDLNDRIENLKYLTPFKYFDAKNLYDTGFEPVYIVLSAVIIAALFWATYIFYKNRDLQI